MKGLLKEMIERKYTRDDIEYDTWYNDWMKLLARTKTRQELNDMYYGASKTGKAAAKSHLNAMEKTGSQYNKCALRASMGNVVRAAGDTKIAIDGALEIYDLFPEHTLEFSRK
jgi:hypothetical protein